jgi:serine/threonine protein kinase
MQRRRAYKLPDEEQIELIALADIARGGMGKVQLARVASGRLAGKHVAVKRLNREFEKDPAYVDMFLDETWMTSTIKSPNVVGVEAWGHDKQGMYLAIELVQGVSLSRLIKESRTKSEPFSERTVACLLSQVCAGLEVAHEVRGDNGEPLALVHRDLTPGNILVGFDGVVKIADFGIAKARSRLTETAGGVMKGKPAYIAPEQARGMEIDRRADLFSVGVILYELLAGHRPWTGHDDLETLIAVTTTEPVDLAQHRRAHDVFLSITRQCLRKNRDERPRSAGEIRQRLDAWRQEKGFMGDDFASLSQFVQRNTPEQLAWFSRALGGLQKEGSTFKEVEEKLDRDRGIARTGDPRVPSKRNGNAQPAPAPASVIAPLSANAPPSASAPRPPVNASDLAATRVYESGAHRGPSSVAKLGATIAMPEASFRPTTNTAAMPMPAVRPRSHSPYPAFQPAPSAERRMAEPAPEIETVAPTVSMQHDTPPISPKLASTVLSHDPMMPPPAAAPAPLPGLKGEATSMGSVLVVRKKTSRATGVVLVLAVLLIAATVAAYFLRGRFLT